MSQAAGSLDDLFFQAIDLDADGLASLMTEIRANDAELAADLAELLRCDGADEGRSFLDRPMDSELQLELVVEAADERKKPERADQPDSLLGTIVDNYKLTRRLGGGGMGVVYLVHHLKLKKDLALKLMRPCVNDEDGLARFDREMEAAARLDHANVVRATDAGEHDGQPFLVMDFLDGVDLKTLIDHRGSLEVADACEVIRQGALGLQHAAEQGLVHRDIKPSNLFLTRDGVVKVVDFGLATLRHGAAGDLTGENDMLGTADYMAPEQWDDVRSADNRADIYSLGCTLYHLLVGRPPFSDEATRSVLQKMKAHVEREPPDPMQLRADIPPQLTSVMMRMLAKTPADRFGTHAELASALAPFSQNARVSAGLQGVLADSPVDHALHETSRMVDLTHPTVIEPGPSPRSKLVPRVLIAVAAVIIAALAWHFRPDDGDSGSQLVAGDDREDPGAAADGGTDPGVVDDQSGAGGPDSNAVPDAADVPELAVDDFQFDHIRYDEARQVPVRLARVYLTGDPGGFEAVDFGDECRIIVTLNRAAYCYLVAFNPDGKPQACWPEADAVPKAVTSFAYPSHETTHFPFTDGRGQQAFVLLTSDSPLPRWTDFAAAAQASMPWQITAQEGLWRRNLSRLRGAPITRRSDCFEDLCDALEQHPDIDDVFGVAFPVR